MNPDHAAAPLVGFRAWNLEDGQLRPVGYREGASWTAGANVARCVRGHRAPEHDCVCGLYALHEWWQLSSTGSAYGAVVAWGRCEVHAAGFRAEFARIVVLAFHPSQPADEVAAVRAAGAALGVPVTTVSERMALTVAEFVT